MAARDLASRLEVSERTVRPLALAFYGPVWTLAAWCELSRTHAETLRRLESEPPLLHM